MAQALFTGEISICGNVNYEVTNFIVGSIYTINIDYRDELVKYTKKYHFLPEKTKEDIEQFTDDQIEKRKRNYKPSENSMLTLTNKDDYVIHNEILDWYLNHGLKLEDKTIINKLRYEKSEWLEPHIDFNIQKRIDAKARVNKFGCVFFKLMNSAFKGKTK